MPTAIPVSPFVWWKTSSSKYYCINILEPCRYFFSARLFFLNDIGQIPQNAWIKRDTDPHGQCLFELTEWVLLVKFHFLEETDACVNVFVHDLVDVDEVDAFAVVGHEIFDEGAALEAFLMAEIKGLCGIEEFDGHDALGVFHDLVAFGGCVAAHADKVFLILAAGDAVDAAG